MMAKDEYKIDANPLVSVVIPTYDRPEFLHTCVKSVLEQTYDEIEIIVVDDNSPSNVRPYIPESAENDGGKQVRYIRHENNQGVSAARNTGIRATTGDLVALLDDDDYWHEEKIEKQVNKFQSSASRTGVIYTNAQTTDDGGDLINSTAEDAKGDVTKQLLKRNFASISTLIVHYSVIESAGGFDEELPSWEDWEWCIRLSKFANFEVVTTPLVTIQKGSHYKRSDQYELKRDEGYQAFIDKIRPIASKYGILFERQTIGQITYSLGYAALSNGNFSDARQFLLKAIKWWPFQWRFYLYLSAALMGERSYQFARSCKRSIEYLRQSLRGL